MLLPPHTHTGVPLRDRYTPPGCATRNRKLSLRTSKSPACPQPAGRGQTPCSLIGWRGGQARGGSAPSHAPCSSALPSLEIRCCTTVGSGALGPFFAIPLQHLSRAPDPIRAGYPMDGLSPAPPAEGQTSAAHLPSPPAAHPADIVTPPIVTSSTHLCQATFESSTFSPELRHELLLLEIWTK